MKQNLISEATVMEEVKKAIAQTQKMNPETIQPEHSLMKDLRAESLDFLDINYRLEQVFGIKTARHFVLEHIEEMFGEGVAIDENSQLTDKAVALLKIRLGEENTKELRPGMDMDEVSSLITVEGLARVVLEILDTLSEKCSSGGHSSWTVENGTRIKCSDCGEYAMFTDGDTLTQEWLRTVQDEKKVF
jgi:acyl carrier protein